MKFNFLSSNNRIIIVIFVCGLVWGAVFFLIGRMSKKERSANTWDNVVFDTSLIPVEIMKYAEPDNFLVNIQASIDDITETAELVNNTIVGRSPDLPAVDNDSSFGIDKRLSISLDEDRFNYFVLIKADLSESDDISYEVEGVTVTIEKVFRNLITNKPESLTHYTYELPGPVKKDRARRNYENGSIVIVLPKL